MKFFAAALITATAMAVPLTQRSCDGTVLPCPADLLPSSQNDTPTTHDIAVGADVSADVSSNIAVDVDVDVDVSAVVDVFVSVTATVANVRANIQADLDVIGTSPFCPPFSRDRN